MELRPKVLVFIDWFYPGYKAGGPIRSCLNMMEFLVDIDFYVVCSDRDYMQDQPYDSITYNEWNTIEDNIFVRYLKAENQTKKEYAKIMSSESFDTYYINGIYSRKFSIMPLQVAKNKNVDIVVAVRGMLKDSAIAVKKTKKKIFLNIAKTLGLFKDVTFHVTNTSEQNDVFNRISKKAKTKIAPNLPKKFVVKPSEVVLKTKGALKVISLARIAPEKNTKYALEVLSQIKEAQVECNLYGAKYDEEYWKQCQNVIDNLPANVSVQYKGVLHPDEIDNELKKHHLMFLPTRGENFGHVIIESIMSGTPVLISDQTPWDSQTLDGIGVVLPLDNPNGFVNAINDIAKKDGEWMNKVHNKCISFAKSYSNNNNAIEQNKLLFLNYD